MIVRIAHRNVIIGIKTNILKGGRIYLGERDIPTILSEEYKTVDFVPDIRTTEQFLIALYKQLQKHGIKVEYISDREGVLTYKGAKMTDFSDQQSLEK